MKTMTELESIRYCSTLGEICTSFFPMNVGKVHSVFETSFNFCLGDDMLTVLQNHRSLVPHGIVVRCEEDFRDIVLVGDSVRLENDQLMIGQHLKITGSKSLEAVNLQYELSKTPVLQKQLYIDKIVMIEHIIAQQENSIEGLYPVLKNLFPKTIKSKLPNNIWTEFLSPRLKELQQALKFEDFHTLEALGKKIAGCGPGLTPSSDDFMCGVCAAIYGFLDTKYIDKEKGVATCKALAQGTVPYTNDISGKQIIYSKNGLFNIELLELLEEFFTKENTKKLPDKTKKVAAHGSTSGADLLTGFCYGVLTILEVE